LREPKKKRERGDQRYNKREKEIKKKKDLSVIIAGMTRYFNVKILVKKKQ